jgi:hypothetical protein
MIEKLKKKWGIDTLFQFFIIFIVFGVTGSVSAKLSGPVTEYLNLNSLPTLIYWPIRIIILFPIYQVLIVWFGFCFGVLVSILTFQKDTFIFNFFYKMSIMMSKKMIKLLSFGYLFK